MAAEGRTVLETPNQEFSVLGGIHLQLILSDLGQALSSGLAYNMKQLQEVALRIVRDIAASSFCDFLGLLGNYHFGIHELGRLKWEGDKSLEVKFLWRSSWGGKPRGSRVAGPG